MTSSTNPTRPRVLIVGGGFAGVACARRLERVLKADEADIVLVTPLDYGLYLPLLPQVAAGVLTPQSIAVRCAGCCGAPGSSLAPPWVSISTPGSAWCG